MSNTAARLRYRPVAAWVGTPHRGYAAAALTGEGKSRK